jgi:CheY-like chemotaxis protein
MFPLAEVPSRTYETELVGLPVLVIDDNEVNRRIFHEVLTRWRMHPTVVDSGPAALEALASGARSGHPFALVLLDANMPVMDGFAVAAQMAAHPELGGATIMMLSSSGTFGDASRCRDLGIRAYLTKPIKQADLFDAISHAFQSPVPPPAAQLPVRQPSAPMSRARVLLVEDNVVNQRVALGLLTRRGHQVQIANDGIEALAALELSSFDLVLMDIQMAEMGGLEATRVIREREAETGRHTRIVAMTAHAMKGDRERYLASGMDGYLCKPIDQTALFAEVERQPSLAVVPAEAGGVAAAGPVDIEAMRRRLADDQLVAEVIGMFLTDYPLRMAEIKRAVDSRDRDGITRATHALRGAAGNLAAAAIVERLRALETLAGGEALDPLVADAAWADLAAEGDRLMTALGASATLSRGIER